MSLEVKVGYSRGSLAHLSGTVRRCMAGRFNENSRQGTRQGIYYRGGTVTSGGTRSRASLSVGGTGRAP